MQRFTAIILFAVAALLAFTSPAFAKGPTVKLSILGPGISEPIETEDSEAVAPNVWGGNFVDWTSPAGAPAAGAPKFTIKFHVKPPRDEVRVMYVVRYVWDPNARRALVYIPGPGDEWYRLNSSTILREGAHGHWYYATETWSRAVRNALVSQQVAVAL